MYHKWLRSFHAVAREGGFTAASKVLNIGQPTITDQVKALEHKFGVELFHRRGRTVTLTDTGRGLLEITQDVFGHEEEAISFLSAARDLKRGQLKLGGVGAPVVMELVEHFQAAYPEIQLNISIDHGTPMLRSLMDFETDVAILAHVEDDPELFYFPYMRSDVVLFVNTDHPWANRKKVRIKELAGEKCILREKTSTTRQVLERALAKAGVALGATLEINSREAVMNGIIRGLGVGAVSELEYVPNERLRAIRISDMDIFISFYVVCLNRRKNRPLIQAFLKIAEDVAGQRVRAAE
ncbi:MAG: LysR substrate-binding domain-containing protein [Proteobacteria bacterium]|nr:LysR substrate-binding domain-containing protein [Pseudomonadota bacterium]